MFSMMFAFLNVLPSSNLRPKKMPFGKSHIEMAFNKTTQTLAVMM
jgi:hypothetical protein